MHFCREKRPDGSFVPYLKPNGTFCEYQSPKLENVNRHIESVHEKKLLKCECGVQLKKTSMSRHKNQSCRLRSDLSTLTAPAQEANKTATTTSTGIATTEPSNEIENVQTYEIKVVTYKDGRIELVQDEIIIDDVPYILTPKIDEANNVGVNDDLGDQLPPTPTSLADESMILHEDVLLSVTDSI